MRNNYRVATTSTRVASKYANPHVVYTKKKLAPETKRLVDAEIKRVARNLADKNAANVTISQQTIDNNGTIDSVLQTIGQGDGSKNQFQGEGITPLGLTIRYTWDTSAADNFNLCRLVVIQWFGPDPASTYPWSYFMENTGSFTAPLSMKNWSNRKQFKILADTGAIQFQVGGGGNGLHYSDQIYIPGRKMRKIFFTNVGAVQKNDIAILQISDSAAAGHPIVSWTSQLVYTDNS